MYKQEVTRCTSMKYGFWTNSDNSKIKFIKLRVNCCQDIGKKSIFRFSKPYSKISILAFLAIIIHSHKKPYLDTSTLVQIPPVARYPKENSIKHYCSLLDNARSHGNLVTVYDLIILHWV